MSDDQSQASAGSRGTITNTPAANPDAFLLLENIDPNTPYRELYDDLQRSLESKYLISTLEPGWKIKKDAQNRIYYVHPELKITQWEQPYDIRYLQLKRKLEELQQEAAQLLAKASPKP